MSLTRGYKYNVQGNRYKEEARYATKEPAPKLMLMNGDLTESEPGRMQILTKSQCESSAILKPSATATIIQKVADERYEEDILRNKL